MDAFLVSGDYILPFSMISSVKIGESEVIIRTSHNEVFNITRGWGFFLENYKAYLNRCAGFSASSDSPCQLFYVGETLKEDRE